MAKEEKVVNRPLEDKYLQMWKDQNIRIGLYARGDYIKGYVIDFSDREIIINSYNHLRIIRRKYIWSIYEDPE